MLTYDTALSSKSACQSRFLDRTSYVASPTLYPLKTSNQWTTQSQYRWNSRRWAQISRITFRPFTNLAIVALISSGGSPMSDNGERLAYYVRESCHQTSFV